MKASIAYWSDKVAPVTRKMWTQAAKVSLSESSYRPSLPFRWYLKWDRNKSSFWAIWKRISDTSGQLSFYFQGRHITTLRGIYLVKSKSRTGYLCMVSHAASIRIALPFSSHTDNFLPVVWPQLPELHWKTKSREQINCQLFLKLAAVLLWWIYFFLALNTWN